jgi:hypothetical protein
MGRAGTLQSAERRIAASMKARERADLEAIESRIAANRNPFPQLGDDLRAVSSGRALPSCRLLHLCRDASPDLEGLRVSTDRRGWGGCDTQGKPGRPPSERTRRMRGNSRRSSSIPTHSWRLV